MCIYNIYLCVCGALKVNTKINTNSKTKIVENPSKPVQLQKPLKQVKIK